MHIFVHTNDVQLIGAKIAAFSFFRALPQESNVSVSVLQTERFPALKAFHGSSFSHKGRKVSFDYNDIQSFTLLRLAVPEVMQYKAKALVVDPDVFWVSDESPCQLFQYVDAKTPIACVHKHHWRTSVMVTNNEHLKDWSMAEALNALRRGDDYKQLIELGHIDQSRINSLPAHFNCFDSLPKNGKVLHFTRRQTQPWRTGLPLREKYEKKLSVRFLKALFGKNKHIPHPNTDLEQLFFQIAKDAFASGHLTQDEVLQAQEDGMIRPDFLDILRA